MAKINSRRKGKTAERAVAKLLEKYWSTVEEGVRFKSTPLSGGAFGDPETRGVFKASGDLMSTSTIFPWSIEIKHREGFSLDNILKGKKSPCWSWWRQCQKAAKEMNQRPMLWFRKNNMEWYVIVGASDTLIYSLREKHEWSKVVEGVDVGDEWPVLFKAKLLLEDVDPRTIGDGMKAGKKNG